MLSDLECKTIPIGPPDRTFLDGSEYWVVYLPSVRIGLGHFRPGWVWSRHAGAQTGQESRSNIGDVSGIVRRKRRRVVATR